MAETGDFTVKVFSRLALKFDSIIYRTFTKFGFTDNCNGFVTAQTRQLS